MWRAAWLTASGIAMGLSIWSMHFIAMLGFDPGGEVRYRIDLTLLSLVLAIGATTFAFFSVSDRSVRRLLAAGTFMGLGICIMHYVGMAAVMTSVRIHNDGLYVALAFAVAITASGGALVAARGERTFLQRALAAIVLGFAIVGMHYVAMLGVRLTSSSAAQPAIDSGIDPFTLAIGVAGGTMLILFLALIAALSDRRFEALAAREAQRSEQQLRAILEHLPFGMFVAAAPVGEILFANAEAEKLVGHPIGGATIWSTSRRMEAEAAHGAIGSDGRLLAPEEHALYQAMHEGRRIGPRVQAYRRGDGAVVQLEVTAAPISHRADSRTLAVVAFQDVTAKLIAEEEARQAAALRDSEERFRLMNELLEERVSAALAEKAQAQEELMHAQRLESLGRLTGGVAHDFNNLLTVVIGALDIILRHPENAARRTKLGEAALAAAKRGERLTAQLLAFARHQPLRTEPCDLNDLILQGEPLMQRAVSEQLSFELRLSKKPAVVRIDPAQFESALLNLIVNAVDATPAGGAISIETQLCDLTENEVPEIAPGRFFCVRVSDTGEGMTREVLSRVFEPFFTTKPAGKGTGLGLSQVYGFVRQSGGGVRVHSVLGQGTTVELYLPVLSEGAQTRPAKPPRESRPHMPLNILLTEDDASVAAITETMLRNLGHQVTRTSAAYQALSALKSDNSFNLLMTDIAMPGGMNGVELAREAAGLHPQLKILLISGYAGESLDTTLANGVWPFLKKPYLQDDLEACLHAIFKDRAEPAQSVAN
jgi:signal transduction histidine kinase/NO-binding membrane sensor protein with MHYT domain/ActR/RegA family two-component response regulator